VARIIAHYEVGKPLGKGGMARVYRARDIRLNRDVAIKILRVGELEDPAGAARFAAEARNLARLRHPNIPAVHDVGQHDDSPYIVEDLVEGRTLEDLLRDGKLDRPARVDILIQVARALGHAHEHGIIHRDVKPGNIIVDAGGEPHLVDFGLSRAEADPALTADGLVAGTPYYMAPEQLHSKHGPPSARTDVYALGVILYQLLTDDVPYCAIDLSDLFMDILRGHAVRPRLLDRSIDPDIEAVCLKAMELAPDDRYASAGELVDDLLRWRAGQPVRARRVTTIATTIRRVTRHRREIAFFALGAAAAVAVLSLAPWAF
jgi:serine/threonine-protein kinase